MDIDGDAAIRLLREPSGSTFLEMAPNCLVQ